MKPKQRASVGGQPLTTRKKYSTKQMQNQNLLVNLKADSKEVCSELLPASANIKSCQQRLLHFKLRLFWD